MNKKQITIITLCSITFLVLMRYYYKSSFISTNEPMKQIWQFNSEKDRNAATILLDCALLVKMTDPLKLLTLGYISGSTIYQLANLAKLYDKSGNTQRNQWLNSFVKTLEKNSIGESSSSYDPGNRKHEKEWERIEELVLSGDMAAVTEKIGNHPYFLAQMGGYYSKQGQKEEANRFFQKALTQLNEAVSEDIHYSTLESVIMGYINIDEGQKAIELYHTHKKSLINIPLKMIKAFVEQENYDFAFNILFEDEWSLYQALIVLAEGHINQNRHVLKNEHKQMIANIVTQHKKAVRILDKLHRGKPGSDAHLEIQKKLIDKINKADKKRTDLN